MGLMGVALLALAGLLGGFGAARGLENTVSRRAALCRMLAGMAWELERFQTPLPELFSALAARTDGVGQVICLTLSRAISRVGEEPFDVLWRQAVGFLPEAERQCVLPLGAVLGRYGAGQQVAALESCRREMEQALEEARRRSRELGRIYIGLCTAGGLMLGVLLV